MAATPVLICNRESILNSLLIQVTHIHPGNAHRIRSDLDQEDLVIDDFPIAIAKAILGTSVFESPQPSKSLNRKRTRSQSPLKRAESAPILDTITLVPPAVKLVKTNTSLRGGDGSVKTATPERQLLPPIPFETGFVLDTDLTSRTMSPGGGACSPLKQSRSQLSPRSPLALLKDTNLIPSALFSPPRAAPSRGRNRGRNRGGIGVLRKPRNPPPVISYDPKPHSVDDSNPKGTVIVRYNLPLRGLRDVFTWSRLCVEESRIVCLEACLLTFHDWDRVQDIREVCVKIGLSKFVSVCDGVLKKWTNRLEYNEDRRMTV